MDTAAKASHLGDADRAELLPSGVQRVCKNRAGWAHDRLKRAALSANLRRGHCQLRGRLRRFRRVARSSGFKRFEEPHWVRIGTCESHLDEWSLERSWSKGNLCLTVRSLPFSPVTPTKHSSSTLSPSRNSSRQSQKPTEEKPYQPSRSCAPFGAVGERRASGQLHSSRLTARRGSWALVA